MAGSFGTTIPVPVSLIQNDGGEALVPAAGGGSRRGCSTPGPESVEGALDHPFQRNVLESQQWANGERIGGQEGG
ncbi:MAG: hypothetical protein OXG44_19570, partial [Gammaproteobacteria bacterium]|nr:hypothetical protein [Gammaproteobacteria bacterium]